MIGYPLKGKLPFSSTKQQSTHFQINFKMTDDEEMSWDYTCGSELLGVATNLTISEEQEAILKEYIIYHDEMKTFLETCLDKGQKEDEIAASVYFKENKPSKPKASLGNLFGNRSRRHHQSVEEIHEFLKSRIINQQLQEEQPAFNSSVYQSWEEISLQIEKHILFGKHKKIKLLLRTSILVYSWKVNHKFTKGKKL